MGAAGHISSLTFVDSSAKPLRPAIGFQDQRAQRELKELYERFSRDDLARRLGIDLPPAATWPLPRLLWIKRHEPETLRKAHRFLQAKDFVNYRLTGEFTTDHSSMRGLVDFAAGTVATSVFSELGLPVRLVPRLCRPDEIIGRLTERAAAETGLRPGLPVVGGWNDLNACVLGSGTVGEGDAFNITGTSEHLGIVTAGKHSTPELISAPFLPGKNLFYGVTSCGGGALACLAQTMGRDADDLLAQAATGPPGSDGLLFLPYLEGERAPIWDAKASGAFIGLRTAHRAGHLARAVLEGVAFSLNQIMARVGQHAHAIKSPLVISGGASRAQLWNQIKADVLHHSVTVPENPNAGVLGAAMLAAVGAGCYKDGEAAARGMVRYSGTLGPDATRAAEYLQSARIFDQLYPALKDSFAATYEQRIRTRNGP